MDIVLVILDTARGDTVNSLIESGNLPNLEALAQNGAWYTKARSTGPWTVPSHASLFTGKYPSEVGITGHDPTYDTVPLIKELNTRGYKTAGFSANPWLSPDFNFDEPYDQFFTKYTFYPTGASMASIVNEDSSMGDRVSDFISEIKGTPISKSIVNTGFWAYQRYFREDSGGYHLLKRAANWLNTGNDDKFAFLNITEPHLPYELPRDWLPEGVSQESLNQIEQDTAKYLAGVSEVSKEDFIILKQTYEATFKYIDSLIGEFVNSIDEETVLLIAGDHGEHFGEFQRYGHQYSLYQDLLHVPLLISGPPVKSNQIDEPVELRSLYDFILSAADNTINRLPQPDVQIAELVSPRPSIEALNEKGDTDLPDFVHKYGSGVRCIERKDTKLLEFANGDLEIVESDESVESTRIIETLKEELYEERGEINWKSSTELDVSGSVKSRLEDLGYT